MESVSRSLEYEKGFEDCFDSIIRVLKAVRASRTHLNDHVRHIANDTIDAIIEGLEETKINAQPSQPPIE